MRNIIFTAALLACASTGAFAAPKADKQWADCISDDAARSIRGCTQVLARGKRESDATRANAYVNRGIEHARAKRWDDALADFKAAAELRSDWAVPHMQMMFVYRETKQPELALAAVNAALERNPAVKDGFYYRADLLDDRDESEGALADINRAIRLNPDDHLAYNLRGILHNKRRELARAIRDFNLGLRLEPKSALLHSNRAWAFSEAGQNEPALADFDFAIQAGSPRPHVLNGRGVVHAKMGNLDLALADFDRALRGDPKLRSARENRVAALVRKKDCRTAMPELDALIAEETKPSLLAYRGTCQGTIGNVAAALIDFDAALASEPTHPLALSGRRKAHGLLGYGAPTTTF